MTKDQRVRVYAVANLRTGRIHGMTCDVNQSAAWVRELIERYNDPLAAVQAVDLVNPAEQDIPWRPPAARLAAESTEEA